MLFGTVLHWNKSITIIRYSYLGDRYNDFKRFINSLNYSIRSHLSLPSCEFPRRCDAIQCHTEYIQRSSTQRDPILATPLAPNVMIAKWRAIRPIQSHTSSGLKGFTRVLHCDHSQHTSDDRIWCSTTRKQVFLTTRRLKAIGTNARVKAVCGHPDITCIDQEGNNGVHSAHSSSWLELWSEANSGGILKYDRLPLPRLHAPLKLQR